MSAKRPPKRRRPSTDGLFDLLRVKRRRDLLALLCSQSDTVTVAELAAELSSGDATHEGVIDERIAVRLHHVDLPKLDAAGLLTYDPADRVVTLGDAGVREALEDAEAALGAIRRAR